MTTATIPTYSGQANIPTLQGVANMSTLSGMGQIQTLRGSGQIPSLRATAEVIVRNEVVEGDTTYTVLKDTTNATIQYLGRALEGSAQSAPLWRIYRIDLSTHPNATITKADGDNNFDNIWANRATLTYS